MFIFHNCWTNDRGQYPPELTAKYTICKQVGEGGFGTVKVAYKNVSILFKSDFIILFTYIYYNHWYSGRVFIESEIL